MLRGSMGEGTADAPEDKQTEAYEQPAQRREAEAAVKRSPVR